MTEEACSTAAQAPGPAAGATGIKMGTVTRGLAWFALYLICWLLMSLSCLLDLPPDCRRPSSAVEVLIELPVLLAFSTGQAVLCGIVEEDRLQGPRRKGIFFAVLIATALIISALTDVKELVTIRESDGSFTPLQSTIIIILLVFLFGGLIYHFSLAWKSLPGAVLISGGGHGKPASGNSAGNQFVEYFLISFMSIVWVMVFGATAFEKGDGWEYHYILVAWMLSLLARFESYVSVIWLSVMTAIFLQGVGAYSLRFLSPWRFGEDEFEDN